MMTILDDLLAFDRDTRALGQISGRLGWDQETMMPPGAAAQRGEEFAAMASVLHARASDPRVGDWLSQIDVAAQDPVTAAKLRIIQRDFDLATKVPDDLAKALAKLTSVAQGVWANARKSEDVAKFLPTLAEIVQLSREKAAAISSGDPYDALLDEYEPGASGADLARMFDALRPRLVGLADKIKGANRPAPQVQGEFAPDLQTKLSEELAKIFGYDFNHGRLDLAVHPFSSGSGSDVRITTRIASDDPFNCLYSTIHEVGHATYEQGINPDFALTPLGSGVSMGVHESQSRILENQLGRSRAFVRHLFSRMSDIFGAFGIADAESFYRAVNSVQPGFIRTEADEIHYNLHIMMRFDLERALIAGDLDVADIEDAWNARFLSDFGVAVDKPSNGVLQDIHWSAGLIGYFPTYSLGNVYAGCLFQTLRRDVPDLDDALSEGDCSSATKWLQENLRQYGSLRGPGETIEHACGFSPNVEPLLSYLEQKFADLYDL